MIPKGILKRALWYVKNKDKYIRMEVDGEGEAMWYILSKDNRGGYKNITNQLVRLYKKACNGEQDKTIQAMDYLLDICFSMHTVSNPPEGYKVCMHV